MDASAPDATGYSLEEETPISENNLLFDAVLFGLNKEFLSIRRWRNDGRCSLCGGTRNPDGVCSFLECPDPLFDNRVAKHEKRFHALESLWSAVKELNADGTGYTPKLAEAVAALRKLESGHA